MKLYIDGYEVSISAKRLFNGKKKANADDTLSFLHRLAAMASEESTDRAIALDIWKQIEKE